MTNEDLQIYFSEHCTVTDNVIRLGSPQLSRGDYLQVKKLLESRGGKWKGGKTSGFVFDSDATPVYTSICDGDLENKKNVYQFFPTHAGDSSCRNRLHQCILYLSQMLFL